MEAMAGQGGSVVIRATEGVDHLAVAAHRKHWRARAGSAGQGNNRHGRSAEDTVIEVPPGTVVRDAENNFVLKDLKQADDSVIAAKGGRGGRGIRISNLQRIVLHGILPAAGMPREERSSWS